MAISVTQAFKDALKGPVDRSQLKVEVLFSGSIWTDITAYVEEMGGTQEELSQLSGGASANTLNLTLINDDGRFSPKNTASPYTGNLLPNKPIRVSSVYGSESVRLFTGYVSNWIPNAKSRNCQVTAEDAARILRRRDIVEETVFNPDAPTSGYYLTRVIERAAWLSGLRWDTCNTKTDTSGNVWAYSDHDGTAITVNKSGGAARATYTLGGALVMTLDLVDLLMPVAPLKGKALAVLDQLAKVVDGAIYFDAQGQLVFRSRMYRNDSTLTSVETLTVSSLEDVTAQTNFEDSRWAQIVNRATVRSTPYTFRTDTTGAVIEEEIPFKGDLFGKYYFDPAEEYPTGSDADLYCEIPNGIKLFKTASYPTAANLVLRSVDNADPTKETNSIKFKSGFPVFEQTRIKVAFENTGASAERIQMLTFRGKLMRPVQKCQSVQRNEASIALYDQRDWEYTNDLIPNAGACKNLAAWKVEDGREPKTVLTLPVMYGIPWLELGDKITVSETITHTVPASEDFIVRRISWRWSLAAFAFTIEACSPAADFTVSSLPVAVVNVETSNQNNNGDEANRISFPTIDKSGSIIGMTNVPALESVISGTPRSYSYGSFFPGQIAYGAGSLWLGGFGKLARVDPLNTLMDGSYTIVDGPVTNEINDAAFANNMGWFITYSDPGISGVGYSIWSLNSSHSGVRKYNTSTQLLYNLLAAKVGSSVNLWCLRITAASTLIELLRWTDLSQTAGSPANTYTIDTGGLYPRGMAATANAIWILTSNSTSSSDTMNLTRFDLGTLTSTLVTTMPNASLSTKAITTDGQFLYILEGDRKKVSKYAISGESVVKVGESASFASSAGAYSIHFDGQMLFCPLDSVSYARVEPVTGSIVAQYNVSGITSSAGLVNDGSALWTCGSGALRRLPIIPTGR